MPDPDANPILDAAIDAWHAGLSVVRVRTDGSKRPKGEWRQYQEHRADLATIEQWFRNGNYGLGVICGAVSGDLEMLELEGRFVAEIGTQAFKEAAKDAGLALLLSRLVNGMLVNSPSNGRHMYYRVVGEAAPNTKLARRPGPPDDNGMPTIEVLIETRGEGGFVVAPPSSGTVHPSGRPWHSKSGTWAAIPTITVDEREALFALCRTFDLMPAPAAVTVAPTSQKIVVRPGRRALDGTSWMDALVEHLAVTYSMRGTLEHYGWTYAYTDRHGRELMTRPGKDEGVSGSINSNGRLVPFSTSTPFATGGTPPTTYDVLDVIAAYEYSGDRMQAARELAERAGIIGTTTPTPPAHVDPVTGEIVRTNALDDTFWTERPHLAHIRQAAQARMVAPAAVLGCILARIAAFTPPSTRIPPIIGASSTLTTYVALRARSGGGKSSATGCAADLLPDTPPGCIGPLGLGSGEGLVDAYFDLVEETDDNGKKQRTKRQVRHGALFTLDEGQALAEMGNRKGSTILPILRTAWSGTDTGQANASIETRRSLRAGNYALGLISLWQDKAAARLIEDVDGGTPQRFVYIDTTDPSIVVDGPEWPGPLQWTPPALIANGGVVGARHLDIDPTIVTEIKTTHAAIQRGDLEIEPLDAHRRLVKLKVAGLLAVLDGRHNVNPEDWQLAERIMTHSDTVRAWIVSEAARNRRDDVERAAHTQVAREAIVEDAAVRRSLARAAKVVWRVAAKHDPEPITRRDATLAINSRDRQNVTIDDVLAEAIRRGYLTESGENAYRLGDSQPS